MFQGYGDQLMVTDSVIKDKDELVALFSSAVQECI